MRMMRYIMLAFLGLTLAGPAMATSLTTPKDILDRSYGWNKLQKYDIYMPGYVDETTPTLFMVHGGGWATGDKANRGVIRNKEAFWTEMGYVVVSANYRLLPKAKPDVQVADVAAALANYQAFARKKGLDPSNLVLMGHSAGGHLVSLLAADPLRWKIEKKVEPWKATVVLDSGALDLVNVMRNSPSKIYRDAFGWNKYYWREMSPTAQLRKNPMPHVLVCSSLRRDTCPSAGAYAQKIRQKSGRASVIPVRLNHEDINKKLGLYNAYTWSVFRTLESFGMMR